MSTTYLDVYAKVVSLQKSGGQRWNLICEDICNLYFVYVKNKDDQLFEYSELWSFLFNVNTKDSMLFKKFVEIFTANEINKKFFCEIVYVAIDDPPLQWWKNINDVLKT